MNFLHRIDFTLLLAPAQSITGNFQIALNFDDDPITYVISGAFAAKTFSQSYSTVATARAGIDQIFSPIQLFLEDLERTITLVNPEGIDTQVFILDFPDTAGNLTGSLQLVFDVDATDIAQLLIVLDGASMIVKRTTIEEVITALKPLGTMRNLLITHARIDLPTL